MSLIPLAPDAATTPDLSLEKMDMRWNGHSASHCLVSHFVAGSGGNANTSFVDGPGATFLARMACTFNVFQ